MAALRLCSIPDCGKAASKSRGWCLGHYKRWRRHGDPLGGGTARGEPLRYLRETVLSYDGDDCFPWPYGKGSNGYGYLQFEGKKHSVHRLVCKLVNGSPPTREHDAAHSCGNGHKGCCAKRHVSWKTCAENMADKLAHGTQQRGEGVVTSKLTEADVREIIALRGKATQKTLAARFGVAPSHISNIHAGKAWAHL